MLSTWKALTHHLPGICQVCGAWPAGPVCTACEQRFSSRLPRCPGCAALMPSGSGHCGSCMTHPSMPDLHACVTAVDYAYPWSELVARFKFRDAPGWAGLFARLILREPAARDLLTQCDVLVPIPLTPQRLGERGYNQAWELIKALRQQTAASGVPALPGLADALVRSGESPDQHSLGREQRLKNLRGAFVVHPDHALQIQRAHVLLVDDVTTTGATLQTAALAMRKAGAQRVSALVFARTPLAALATGA